MKQVKGLREFSAQSQPGESIVFWRDGRKADRETGKLLEQACVGLPPREKTLEAP